MAGIAIHGFGRIGRSLLRAALKNNLFVPVSISDIRDIPTLAALFEVDSNYGRWPEEVASTDGGLVIGGREIRYFDSTKALRDIVAMWRLPFQTFGSADEDDPGPPEPTPEMRIVPRI